MCAPLGTRRFMSATRWHGIFTLLGWLRLCDKILGNKQIITCGFALHSKQICRTVPHRHLISAYLASADGCPVNALARIFV